jgi:catecholate siderophore receptor
MSSVRVPGSLRRPVSLKPLGCEDELSALKEAPRVAAATAVCLLAATPAAFAQSTSGQVTLPSVTVEGKSPPKKAANPKSTPAAKTETPVQPTPEQKSADPYANKEAPYKVERSASDKFTQPLADTPRSITAVSKEVLEDKAVTSIRELARQTPGVVLGFAEGGNAFGDSIYIRGFNARGDIFVDGLRDPGNASRETFAVDQVEIYKGPGGTIGGRGVTGGAVNIVTKKPNEQNNFFDVSTMFGTDKTVRTTVDVNQVVSPGLAVRGNILFHDSHVAGRDDDVQDQRWGGLLAATIKPSDSFKFTIDYYRYRTDGTPDFGVPFDPRTGLPVTETAGVNRKTWYGDARPGRDFMKNDADIVTGTAEWKISKDVVLTSKTRVGQTTVDYLASSTEATTISNATLPSTWTTNVHNANRKQQTELLANQTDLTVKLDTGGLKHTVVTGVELSREKVTQQSYQLSPGTNLPNQDVNLFDPSLPGLNPATYTPTALTAPIHRNVDTAAVYLLDTVQLSPQWFINGGVRLDHFDRRDDGPATGTTNDNNNPNGSRQDTLFNWNAGIVYKPVPIGSIYFAYATSSNPVGQELDATGVDYGGLTVSLTGLKPEKNTAMEVGTKWELFGRRLLATAALFETTKENAREANPAGNGANGPGNGNIPTSTGEFRVRGVDLGVQGNVTEKWSVYGGLVVMETEILKSSTAANVGKKLANIPDQQFNLLTKYKLTDHLTIGGQAIYASEVLGGLFAPAVSPTGAPIHIPSHWRFDLLSEYKFTDHFAVQLNVVNLTNELYYDSLYRNTTPFAFVAPGRAAYVTLNWKY